MKRIFTLLLIAVSLATGAQPFVPGNVVVYRIGDGAAPLRSVSTKIFLDEYTVTGTLVRSIEMPTTASGTNNPITGSGTATSEGYLSRSANGEFLVMGGYSVDTGVVSVASSPATTYKRVIGRVDYGGNINTSTLLDSAFTNGNIRGVATQNGTAFWMSGSTTGIRYTTLGISADKRVTSAAAAYPGNYRAVHIFNGQLYASTGSGTTFRLVTIGTGTPTDTGTVVAQLPGIAPAGSPNQFIILDVNGTPVLYVADESAQTSNGGIQKYTWNGTSWVANGVIYVTTSTRGLAGTVAGTVVNLYISTPTEIFQMTDASGPGAAITGTPVSIATAPANTAFRGLAMAPEMLAPLNLISFNGNLLQGAVKLTWTTNSEVNVKSYTVMKSTDGRNFSVLGNVAALNRAEANYSFTDANPVSGVNYYRLRMTDKDGSFKMSSVVSVVTGKDLKLSVFPNPAVNNVKVSHAKAGETATLRILTTSGQLVKQVKVLNGSIQTSISTADVPKGNYVVVFENEGSKEIAQMIRQ